MAIDYGMSEGGFGMDPGMGMPDAAMLGNILGDLTAKITVETEEIPDDYTGVPKKTKTVEEVDLAELLPGPSRCLNRWPSRSSPEAWAFRPRSL